MEDRSVTGYLRQAEWKDCKLIFDWANDAEVRKQSFSSEKIEYADHEKWYQQKLKDSCHDFYIYMIEDSCVGQIRVACEDKVGRISYSIGREYRYQGYGRKMLLLVEREYEPGFCLEGEVKFDNVSSQRCFESLGYTRTMKQECILYRKVLGKG